VSVSSGFIIVLTDLERALLTSRARGARTPHRDRQRAQVVLAIDEGTSNAATARQVGVCVDTVRKWRSRFTLKRLAGLRDNARTGRPTVLPAGHRAEVTALACSLPANSGVALARWSVPDIARQVSEQTQVSVSASTVSRWLKDDALKPWQHHSWISVRDPDFAAKAARVLDLYAGQWKGRRLRPGDYVISADEKTSIQARCRCHPTLPPGRARAMRVQHDYERGGALAYLAAWDVHRGQVIGRCEPTTGIEPFERLVEQVMSSQPYASARRVFWIVDNGSSHRGQASIDRLRRAWPRATLVHTPIHASWLNQIEIFFSIIQRKVVTPNDFTDLHQIRERLTAFENHYNSLATPFAWRYTKAHLNELLKRLDEHDLAA
jgi:transposase